MIFIYCVKCGTSDSNYFIYKGDSLYCKVCSSFQKQVANISKSIRPITPKINLKYKLTPSQREIGYKLLKEKGEIYLKAVCGAGKTEIIFPSIYSALKQGKRVGIAIPRKEIVKEISKRIKEIFINVKTISVYGGHDQELDGDIIVLTTHQCYRYKEKFGLLIVDEYDAFPFKDNKTLQKMTKESGYDKKIFLSATFDFDEIKHNTYYELNKRYHSKPMPIPTIVKKTKVGMFLKTYQYVKNKNKDEYVFIYVSSIEKGKNLSRLLKRFKVRNIFFSSLSKEKEYFEIKNKEHQVVITTTILERGVTFPKLNVIVYDANNNIFDYRTLIQIAGRVGRNKLHPVGDILFLTTKKTKTLKKVINDLENINEKM